MPEPMKAVEFPCEVTNKILAHYDAHARELPWRNPPNNPSITALPDPYHVWLSEIMLQQTTVAAVKPYYARFLGQWGDVASLAAADDGDVMAAWAGLGYYARARNLLACARAVVVDHDGRFPEDEATLRTLPGIGAYSAAAIVAIAYGKRAVVVDGNVERVLARYYAVDTPMPGVKPLLRRYADQLTPDNRAGDYAQGVMDLGATICTPRSPDCRACPLNADCQGKADPEFYPVKPAKLLRPRRTGTAWWIERDGQVLLVRRPAKGLLGGMLALPSCTWQGARPAHPLVGDWQHFGCVDHVFTHFALTLDIFARMTAPDCATELGGQWCAIDRLGDAGLPSLFAKAVQTAMNRRIKDGP